MNRLFVGGPRAGQSEAVMSAVPSKRLRLFREASGELVCGDEQVVDELGSYLRMDAMSAGVWVYRWFPKEHA